MNPTKPKAPPLEPFELELLRELELQNADQIRRARAHERLEIRVAVVARPGNSSKVSSFRSEGQTLDVSAGGCRAVFPDPLRVGDVYRLRFERAGLDLPLVFARCLRCRLLREDAFEVGFSFFTPIELGVETTTTSDDLLG